ncbi:C4-dicarboxylate transporter, small permease component [Psychromonas sp. CNPT3]|uniref:TRAP transporter small permease n=1 Tax=Psychromonas sp. CNPT3 TaxID=314282 RepID=UPI00006E7088|nr:TRAP transporter small permease [Psychromonas sp. CNPT3]AGH80052.1 C4-dicarboxylate transporter, small permease component [Psychromonas sp. CNPT3]
MHTNNKLNQNENGLSKIINKSKYFIDQIVSTICIFIVGIMTILVTYQVVVRYLFDSPSAISEVLSRYLFIWLILFSSAYVFGQREHMAITFFRNKFSKKMQILLDMFSELVTASFVLMIMILGGYSGTARQMWQLDSALQIPMGVIYSAIPICGVLIILYGIHNEYHLLQKLKNLDTKINNKEVS